VRKPKMLVNYCRKSTENQKEEGIIELQGKSLIKYTDKNGY